MSNCDDSIYIEYRNVAEMAGRLEELAHMLRTGTASCTDNIKADLSASWSGEAGRLCADKTDMLAFRTGVNAGLLKSCAYTMRMAALEYNLAEEISRAIFG